ncbi:M20/M25/M40 family metallo-hydrolase [Actinophytocola glycyrrhizae]|uniref:M20/M25/M40 family metallo-hydrolase n=1 Tax=Actinophytocola glycyrrhizae TaxID=2044873 RepID=A0ABV9S250_9PSEU
MTFLDTPRRAVAGLVLLLVTAGVITGAALLQRGVAPEPASAVPSTFSAERAMRHLEQFAREPRPMGSPAGERTERYLTDELRAAGLSVAVQHAVGVYTADGLATFGRVDNIIATLPGTDPSGMVVLAAHHDSAAQGPGASDDGAAVAAMLETVRALRTGDRPRNDVVLLITDGEEHGLLGAEAFLREHPLGRRDGVVLNFEARGVSGPSLMFETSQNNARLVDLFNDTVPHPRGDSSMVEVYRVLPNNTDFTRFAEAGFSGLNFAYIEGAARYHTAGDSLANLDRGSLQHHGDNMLTLTRALGDADLRTMSADHDNTYFDLLGMKVSYPNALVWPLAVVALLLVALLTWLATRRGLTTVGRTALAAATAAVPLAVAFGLGQLVWTVLTWARPSYETGGGLLHRPALFNAAVMLMAVVALLTWYLLLRRRLGSTALALGGLTWHALLGTALAAYAPGASFLFTIPALMATLGATVALLAPRPQWSVAALAVGSIAGSALLPYFAYMLLGAVGLSLAGVGATFAVLFGLLLLPATELLLPGIGPDSAAKSRGRHTTKAIPAAALLVSAALVAAGLAVDRPDAAHPAPTHLAYVLNADTGEATWVSAERTPGDWAATHVDSRNTDALPKGYQRGPVWTGPAPAINAEGPELTNVTKNNDEITFHIRSPRNARSITLRLNEPITRATARVPGTNAATTPVTGTRKDTWPTELRFQDLPAEGVTLTIRTTAPNPRLTAIDTTAGLPDTTPIPNSATPSTREDGNVTAVARTYTL